MNAQSSTLASQPATGTVDNHIIAAMRFVLAGSGLLIILIDPSEPSRLVAFTYTVLGLYAAYSLALYILAWRFSRLLTAIYHWAHWADVAWYLLLITLSRGTSSIFFFGFFFAILVASFRWGFASGLRVTLVSALLFSTVGFATAPAGAEFELNRFLIRPIYLLALGYMMAYWGGFEIGLKRRLALLKDVSTLSNPRFGIDRTITSVMERTRAFFDADACLLLMTDLATGEHHLWRAERQNSEHAAAAQAIPAEFADMLLALPPEIAVIYSRRSRIWHRVRGLRAYEAHNILTGERRDEEQAASAALASVLDAESFLSVPLRYQNRTIGRVFHTSHQQHAFDEADIDLILQVVEQVMPVIDNIRLVDRLASEAADEERRKIARDLHDSVIQPYIGLQIGLAAVRHKLTSQGADISGDLDRLVAMTGDGIAELRGYVRGLKGSGERESSLLAAVRRFATKFSQATGIAVDVEAGENIRVNDRLAAELFQMVAEGLSNVRRHTQAEQAAIHLTRRENQIVLRLENEGTPEAKPKLFTPRSITERAMALGGRARVEFGHGNRTAVIVEIPL